LNRFFRGALFPLIIIAALGWLASQSMGGHGTKTQPETLYTVLTTIKSEPGSIDHALFVPSKQELDVYETPAAGGKKIVVHYAGDQSQAQIQNLLLNNKVNFDSKGVGGSPWWSILMSLLPFVLLIGFWIFLMNKMQGGGSKVMSFGKSRAKRMTPDSPKIGFKDVAGVDEAVEELGEIKEFLENPKKFQALGARIPKGVLLYGPPGTGKTLLARAVAGEAGVPFFSISGSDFVEMFVGVGASRVRDLFEQAKQASPCIVFVDEIDAVGRHRGAGFGGGNDEREQTLNQLLVEMDGFEMKDNIILIAATNRPDILDPALLRPGRFDRQIVVDRPDRIGRRRILEVHTKGKPLAPEIDLETLASGTPGFTGADLANLVNEAALLAARRGKKIIEQDELEEGIMRVIAGPEKKARLLSEHERKITAYHEMGHALVGHFLEHTDPVHKITIVSRGQALGLTISLPTEDRYLTTKTSLMHQMAMTLGGRAAEEIVFHEVTTGAANDLEKVTSTSKQMIMKLGMSEKLGPRVLGNSNDMPFLGRDYGAQADYSEEIAREIDDEIRRVIEEAHELALVVLREHMGDLHKISMILIERETIDRDQFERLLAGEDESIVSPEPEAAPETPAPTEEPKRERQPGRPRPFPLPGATMQPPPDPANQSKQSPRNSGGLTTSPARSTHSSRKPTNKNTPAPLDIYRSITPGRARP
jgi:cell division protease FtsH